jgi:hypothetical protein
MKLAVGTAFLAIASLAPSSVLATSSPATLPQVQKLLAPNSADAAASPSTETFVFVRHGEKPKGGLGQLDCKGLNRAMALPKRLAAFGKAVAIFAPDPSARKKDSGKSYDYVRPFATIEPTAVADGLPVNVEHAFKDTDGLLANAQVAGYRSGVVLVAWEHHLIVKAVRDLVGSHGGDASLVPDWAEGDFDGIYVVRVTLGPKASVTFTRETEGLDELPETCR